MSSPVVEPADVALELIGWLATGPEVSREEMVDAVLIHRPLPEPWFATATRLQLDASDVAGAIHRIRSWFGARGRTEFFWSVSDASTPADLARLLVEAGAIRDEDLTAMILDREPPAGPPDIDVRPVTTFDEFLAHERIAIRGFGFDAATAATAIAAAERSWAHWQTESDRTMYLAWHGGEAIAEAGLAATLAGPMVLSGGATLPEARGRGAYRALVRARWDEAVRRGEPVLVVQASSMSRPILERSGFRPVGAVTLLMDRSA